MLGFQQSVTWRQGARVQLMCWDPAQKHINCRSRSGLLSSELPFRAPTSGNVPPTESAKAPRYRTLAPAPPCVFGFPLKDKVSLPRGRHTPLALSPCLLLKVQ